MIRMLDQTTINKIAAGEVVERPSSVVKELVENAIDAGANAITVEIKGGGIDLIRITDNGEGIEHKDIRSAFLRHSTSKIRQIEDLDSIASLGFRGEALASIASVSSVELLTKRENENLGSRYVIEGGKEQAFEEVGTPEGTTLIIKHLFFNTPVRKKFLKTASTEASYVAELMNKLALGHPKISFKYIQNGSVKLYTAGNGKLMDVIFNIFGKSTTTKLVPIHILTERMTINGFLGKPELARGNRNYENYFINGRYVKSKVLQKAIEEAFAPKLILHRFPFVVLHLHMDGDRVDVNVHPTKMDVRFDEEKHIYSELFQGITDTLNQQELIPEVSFGKEEKDKKPVIDKSLVEPFESKRKEETIYELKEKTDKFTQSSKELTEDELTEEKRDVLISKDFFIKEDQAKSVWQPKLSDTDMTPFKRTVDPEPEHLEPETVKEIPKEDYGDQTELESHFIEELSIKEHKIIGQMFKTYWIVEFKDKYYIIDQHAAHERVLYEQMLSEMDQGSIGSQGLLNSKLVHVTASEMERYIDHQRLFAEIGFDIEVFGDDALMIRGVPYVFGGVMDISEFTVILDELSDQYSENQARSIMEKLASMSCKAAVKAHDRMTDLECHRLIDDLLDLENPFHCPHGRPTIISMTKYELEKKFKRIV